MLEARLSQAAVLKKVLDAIRELVTDVNFDFSETGVRMEMMDSSQVALTAVELRSESFEPYRCDRPMSVGMSVAALSKVLKTANPDDVLTIKKDDDSDSLGLIFEDGKKDRVSEFDLKTLDIDAEHLGIPDANFEAVVKMGSGEYARIVRDMSNIGDSVKIAVTKEGVNFNVEGEIGNASLTLKQGGSSAPAVSKPEKNGADDEDDDEDEEDDEKPQTKKRKTKAAATSSKDKSTADGDSVPVTIRMQQAVTLTFSLKYLANFAKAAPLAREVALHMSDSIPLLVEFAFDNGYVRYYLAPKLAEEDE